MGLWRWRRLSRVLGSVVEERNWKRSLGLLSSSRNSIASDLCTNRGGWLVRSILTVLVTYHSSTCLQYFICFLSAWQKIKLIRVVQASRDNYIIY